jgi:hypothetical protein
MWVLREKAGDGGEILNVNGLVTETESMVGFGGFWWVFVFLLSLLVSLDTARFPQAKNISLTLFIRLVLVLGLHSIEIEMEIWSGSNIKGEIEKH